MKIQDGLLKNALREGVKLLNKGKHDRYDRTIKGRSRELPDFSLLTSDCMAGLIYHTMGRKFLSPTINLSIEDSDFLKFLKNIKYYLDCELYFGEKTYYPIGYIGEGNKKIRICFEHYKTEEDARCKWEARKNRILWNNLFVIIADRNLSSEELESFKHLEDYIDVKRKVMFTWDEDHSDNKDIVLVKKYGRERIKNWSKIRMDGFRDYEVFFDYVAWLNMEEEYMLDQSI